MDAITANILVGLACLLFGYLLGSIQNGIWIGKVFFHKDPRDYGSGNSGGTNSGRVFGRKIGFLVIALDMLKVIVAFWASFVFIKYTNFRTEVPLWDDGVLFVWLAPLGAAFGHCWPIFYGFKGGKTVACFFATNGGISWLSFIVCSISFFAVFLKKRIVSLASILGGLFTVFFQWIMYTVITVTDYANTEGFAWTFGLSGSPWFHFFGWEAASVSTIVYIILVWRHHSNISRLLKGEEPIVAKHPAEK